MIATMVLVGLAVGTYSLKAVGPLVLGGRTLPTSMMRVTGLLPAALLAALVVSSGLMADGAPSLDARAAGLAAAAVALWRKAPFVVVVLLAALVTAMVRAAVRLIG